VALSAETKRALWASSAGYCQNPGCRADLIQLFQTGDVTNLDELAHIVASKKHGPRGKDVVSGSRDAFENVIILCPTCHTLIDKAPDKYPTDLLLKWKAEHITVIYNALASVFKTRQEFGEHVHRILRRNKAIFDEYGPHSKAAAKNPLSDAASAWQRLVLSDILPNNRELLMLLRRNQELLDRKERELMERFRIHAEALEYNHISGDKNSSAPIFPDEINKILT
jgi:hypothetical protein